MTMIPDDFGNPWMAKLTEIGTPEEVGLWPLAPGWFVLAGLMLIGLLWTMWKIIALWRANAYRREALSRLQAIEKLARSSEGTHSALAKIPVLLKQTALAAYSRVGVASLSGDEWAQFLESTGATSEFAGGYAQTLQIVAYAPEGAKDLSDVEINELFKLSRRWIKRHRSRPEGGMGALRSAIRGGESPDNVARTSSFGSTSC